MRTHSLASLFQIFEFLRPAFTRPTFERFVLVAMGWLLTSGRHAVTSALVVLGIAPDVHHATFHRLLSLAKWSPDRLGLILLELIVAVLNDNAPISLLLDDTLAPHKGPKVFGLGSHIDAVRSTKRHKVFSFGHVWVVLSVVVHLPFCRRPWALPILFRLYKNKKTCQRTQASYSKKTELARQLLDLVAQHLDEARPCWVVADQGYCNRTVLTGLLQRFVFVGNLRMDAALHAQPPSPPSGARGRKKLRGRRLKTPETMTRDGRRPWREAQVHIYRSARTLHYKVLCAQWFHVCHARLLKIVIVRTCGGKLPYRTFFCSDPNISVELLVESYGARFCIEVLFRDLKQHLGFSESSAWSEQAVLRTAPFVGLLYTLVVLWFCRVGVAHPLALCPIRPWYRTKVAPSFADMLFAMQVSLRQSGLFDTCRGYGQLNDILEQNRGGSSEPQKEVKTAS